MTNKFEEDFKGEEMNSSESILMINVRARWEMPANDKLVNSSAKNCQKCKTDVQNGPGDVSHYLSNQVVQNNNVQNGCVKHETLQDMQMTMKKTPTLNGVNIRIPSGKLIGVVGAVGAGKTSLLQVLLHELPLESGSISINGTISYASQEPWVFAASVRQNILFGGEYYRDRYNSVVQACALTKDFKQFENGDQTIVGERGASLSGGQKARIR